MSDGIDVMRVCIIMMMTMISYLGGSIFAVDYFKVAKAGRVPRRCVKTHGYWIVVGFGWVRIFVQNFSLYRIKIDRQSLS